MEEQKSHTAIAETELHEKPRLEDRRPNKDLTPDERIAKRDLKKQLKDQQKRLRLETRLRHAEIRNDPQCVEESKEALKELFATSSVAPASLDHSTEPHEDRARAFIIQLCKDLHQKQQEHGNTVATKEEQTRQAVSLLRHMTKGTQAKSMFHDPDTLWGYARQKFLERAMLVCNSFLKISPSYPCSAVHLSLEERRLRQDAWDGLRSVRRICSIGCGPGNDAVGVAAFLKSIYLPTKNNHTPHLLEQAILLDWAMDEWRVVIQPLHDLIVPQYIQTLETASCDVSEALYSDQNQIALQLLVNKDISDVPSSVDLFLVSYLLTEVRGQWATFMKELVALAKNGALFYFAEPTPWQLHRIRTLLQDELEFVWLDSSMNHPHLQSLDNRVGPGVLLGLKR